MTYFTNKDVSFVWSPDRLHTHMYNMQQTTTNVCHKWSALIWTQSVAGPNRFIHTENECQNGPKWRVHGLISDVMVTNVKSEFSHIFCWFCWSGTILGAAK